MEQGSLRCDVNTSLNLPGAEWGTRTETKNVNSLRSVERAVRSEILRQAGLLDAGERIKQETRHFSETTGDTRPGRSKEEATDYRYFPEPDLVPVAPDAEWIETLRAGLPELPAARRARMIDALGCRRRRAAADDQRRRGRPRGATVEAGAPVAEARNWWMGYLAQKANEREVEPAELGVDPAHVARLIALVADGSLSTALARQAVDGVLETGHDVDAVVAERGLKRVVRHRRARGRGRRRDRREPRRRRQGPRRQAARGRRAGGCGHEGDARPGRCRRRPDDLAA